MPLRATGLLGNGLILAQLTVRVYCTFQNPPATLLLIDVASAIADGDV